jgi:hypothetical protein
LSERFPVELLKTKTVRFTEVVAACGNPEVYTLWLPPKEDRHFQAQLGRSRIMTIQRSAAGREFGCVGFIEGRGAMYVAFSKSLKRFADQRIVGIKWGLVKT